MTGEVLFRGRSIRLIVMELCHYPEYGDYTVMPGEDLGLNLAATQQALRTCDELQFEGLQPPMLLLAKAHMPLTLYDTGRLLVENVRPDFPETALQAAQQILSRAL